MSVWSGYFRKLNWNSAKAGTHDRRYSCLVMLKAGKVAGMQRASERGLDLGLHTSPKPRRSLTRITLWAS